jgi:hypothetical protein
MVSIGQLRCSLERLSSGCGISSLLAITGSLVGLGERAVEEWRHRETLERRQQVPAELLRLSGSFDGNPIALDFLHLDVQPVKRRAKISSRDATISFIGYPAPGKEPIAWHQPSAKACGLGSDGLNDQPRSGERARRSLDRVARGAHRSRSRGEGREERRDGQEAQGGQLEAPI